MNVDAARVFTPPVVDILVLILTSDSKVFFQDVKRNIRCSKYDALSPYGIPETCLLLHVSFCLLCMGGCRISIFG